MENHTVKNVLWYEKLLVNYIKCGYNIHRSSNTSLHQMMSPVTVQTGR